MKKLFYLTLISFEIISGIHSQSKYDVIISTDAACEIDDQWMLAYILGDENFNILGLISSHYGNRSGSDESQKSYEVITKILETSNKENINLLKGSSSKDSTNLDVIEKLYEIIQSSPSNNIKIIISGPATDISQLILKYPEVVNRVEIIATAFTSKSKGKSFNVTNDLSAWQIILKSDVPITVCNNQISKKSFLKSFHELKKTFLHEKSEIVDYLYTVTKDWFFNNKVIIETITGDKNRWPLWDLVLPAYISGDCEIEVIERPILLDNGYFNYYVSSEHKVMNWITSCKSNKTFDKLEENLKRL